MKENKSLQTILIVVGILLVIVIATFFLRGASPRSDFDTALSINGDKISLDEFRRAYITFTPSQAVVTTEQAVQEVADNLINYRLMVQDAKKKKIVASDEEINAQLETIAQNNGVTLSQLAAVLGAEEYNRVRASVREDIVVAKALSGALEGTETTPEDAEQFYQANIASFSIPNYVMVRQIYLARGTRSNEELLELSQTIADELTKTDFCEVSNTYSDEKDDCQTFLIARGTVAKQYEQVAFGLEIGQVGIVQSEGGIQFVQTLSKLDFKQIPLEAVNQSLVENLALAKRQSAYRNYIKELRDSATIRNYMIG